MARQFSEDKSRFGGSLLKGNPKCRRPYESDLALHVVLRSKLARGPRSFLLRHHAKKVHGILLRQADRFGITLYRFANSGNHLHLLLRPSRRREDLANFMRAITGLIARQILKAERGAAKKTKFWDARPFSRIVQWGRAFQICAKYIEKNIFEALGFDGLETELVNFTVRKLRAPPGA